MSVLLPPPRCERGKGVKPRWAVHGVEFLIIASGPNYTKHLNDDEFAAFKVGLEFHTHYRNIGLILVSKYTSLVVAKLTTLT